MTKKEKTLAFLQRAATVLAIIVIVVSAIAVVFFVLLLARKHEVSDEFFRLVDAVVSPTVVAVIVIAGVVVWFVNKFSEEIRNFINRIKKIGDVEFHPQHFASASESLETASPAKVTADEESTGKTPAAKSVADDKGKSGEKLDSTKTTPLSNTFAEIKKRADKRDAEAQCNLGLIYLFGKGVVQDDAEAVKWFRQAAGQGHARAQSNLGVMYATGKGVAQDEMKAVKWYHLAAKEGYAATQYALGVRYANGKGVAQDDVEAVKWYRRAAEQGYAKAQTNLGVAYHNGRGVAQNYREAYVWHSIAAGNGMEESVKLRNDDAKLLSAEDLAQAQAEATRRLEEIRKQTKKEE